MNFVNNTTTPPTNASAFQLDMQVSLTSWLGVSLTVNLIGSLLLIILLLASFHRKKLQEGTGYIIIHLLFLQLLICAVFSPIQNITTYMAIKRLPYRLSCSTFFLLQTFVMNAINWTEVLLAISRYVAVRLPHHYRKLTSVNALTTMVGLPWLIGVAASLPIYYGIGNEFIRSPQYGHCIIKLKTATSGLFFTSVGLYIPTVVMGIIYMALFVHLAVRNRQVFASQPRREQQRIPTRNTRAEQSRTRQVSLAKMLLASFAWYCVCFLPGTLMTIVIPSAMFQHIMMQLWFGRTFILCGYAGTPAIFLVVSQDYQNGVRSLWTRIWSKERTQMQVLEHIRNLTERSESWNHR